MQTSNDLLIINSEDSIFDVLTDLMSLPQSIDDFNQLSFDGFPTLQIRLRGDKFHGTITTSVMKSLIELQKAIYKSYAQAIYNSDNINKLSKLEKDNLELIIKVEEGCTLLNIDAQETLNNWISAMADKLTPKTIAAITLGVAALYFSYSGYTNYLNTQKEIRMAEINDESQKGTLEKIVELSENEKEKMQLIADLKMQYPQVSNIQVHAEEAQHSLVKSFSKADEVELGGTVIDGDVAEELTKSKRKTATQGRADGDYRILSVDSTDPLMFKVKIRNISNNEEFMATVQDETLEQRYKTLIQKAEWNRTPVKLDINARLIGEEVREATVIGASEYNQN